MTLTPQQTQQILDWCDKHEVKRPILYTRHSNLSFDNHIETREDLVIYIKDILDWLKVVLVDKENPEIDRLRKKEKVALEILHDQTRGNETRYMAHGEARNLQAYIDCEAPTLHEALYRSAYQVEYGEYNKAVDDWFDEVMQVLEELKK